MHYPYEPVQIPKQVFIIRVLFVCLFLFVIFFSSLLGLILVPLFSAKLVSSIVSCEPVLELRTV